MRKRKIKTKICTKCGGKYPATPKYFYRLKRNKNGLDPRCKTCCNRIIKKYQQTEKGKAANKRAQIKHCYGITFVEYNKIFEQQNGRCVICGKHQSRLTQCLSVDHNHKTGKVRGLLCKYCNFGISFIDNKKFMKKAINYLEKK